MRQITEYLTTKVSKSKIKATDETIKQIIKNEIDKYGHDCDLNHVDVSEVTNMYSLFSCDSNDLGKSYSDLNPDVSEWDVSKVIDMRYMFFECKSFNQELSMWKVSNVRYMSSMFHGCTNFNQNLNRWDVHCVKYMTEMFCGCTSFNQDLSKWNVSSVKFYTGIFDFCDIEEKNKPKFK